MKMLKLALLILPIFILGCSDSGDSPTAPSNGGGGTVTDPSFATDIAPLIVGNNCLNSGCHGSGSISGGLSLGSGSYSDIRNGAGLHGAIITVNNAASSNFYLKLTSSPPFGSQMPLTGTKLSTTNLDKIRDWINQGAKDN